MEAVGKEEEGRVHALLSASGASRWINCPPSARLEEKYGINKESSYAAEGTLAHELGEVNLNLGIKKISKKEYAARIEIIKSNKFYNYEMKDEVDKYVQYIMEEYKTACRKVKDSILLIEQRLDFSHLVKEGFGTGDACIISDGILSINDLKYGKGVRVDAENNSQLMLYGLGALKEFELLYDIHTIRLTIIQPRLDHISTWEISVDDLIKWGDEVIIPKSELAYSGKGEYNCGEWCKWCKVKPRCKKLADQNMEIAKWDFETPEEKLIDPNLLTDDAIIEIYSQLSLFKEWISSIETYMLAEALSGKNWEGLKLVEGRSLRKWADEEKVISFLKSKGFEQDQFMKSKLAGLTDIEKLIGKGIFNSVLSPYIIKPSGAPTLVSVSDKRPAMGVEQAKLDFQS